MVLFILFPSRKNLKMPKMSLIKPISYVKMIVRYSRPKSVLVSLSACTFKESLLKVMKF